MPEIEVLKIAPQRNEPPFTPFVQVWLSQHTVDSNGRILLSPELMTDFEIDEAVDFLVTQLEQTRKKAKQALKKK
jgi:hypothetical protein